LHPRRATARKRAGAGGSRARKLMGETRETVYVVFDGEVISSSFGFDHRALIAFRA